jgi:hypothetical protein
MEDMDRRYRMLFWTVAFKRLVIGHHGAITEVVWVNFTATLDMPGARAFHPLDTGIALGRKHHMSIPCRKSGAGQRICRQTFQPLSRRGRTSKRTAGSGVESQIVNEASSELTIRQSGSAQALTPLDLSTEPELDALIKTVDLTEQD